MFKLFWLTFEVNKVMYSNLYTAPIPNGTCTSLFSPHLILFIKYRSNYLKNPLLFYIALHEEFLLLISPLILLIYVHH